VRLSVTPDAITSLDGLIKDEEGKAAWAEPDEEVRAFVIDLERGTVVS
jgi:hypothetical protein